MEFLLMGMIVVLVLAAISVTGSLRVIRDASERTAAAAEALLELERSKQSTQ
ncbi:hypothetical protein LQ757_11180 [Agromyces sp. SYSU K20354]|uniref:hypothetical protein n=1 Tax=Agromyces cavernae TaxID=2898659 RepID=UPI001E53FD77|nr:hypothetical protein [Agromyces cavernae]MCD2442835.1 hypothetical protein [Agromyces cavernae]